MGFSVVRTGCLDLLELPHFQASCGNIGSVAMPLLKMPGRTGQKRQSNIFKAGQGFRNRVRDKFSRRMNCRHGHSIKWGVAVSAISILTKAGVQP